jgi:lysophospholipase L1-like esterase
VRVNNTYCAVRVLCGVILATTAATGAMVPGARRVDAATAPVKLSQPIKILVLGDSYSAGNGAGAPTGNYYGPSKCMRSHANWAEQYAKTLGESGFQPTLINHACSGAVAQDMWIDRKMETITGVAPSGKGKSTAQLEAAVYKAGRCEAAYKDEEYWKFDHIVLDSLTLSISYTCTRFLKAQLDFVDKTYDLVLFTIGGNDAGFADIAQQCFVQGYRDPKDCRDHVDSGKAVLRDKLPARLSRIMNSLGGSLAPAAKIVLASYPYLERDPGYRLTSLLRDDHYDAGAQVRALGDQGDVVQRHAVDQYNAGASGKAQAIFVDKTKKTFAGHEPHGDANDPGANRWIFNYLDTTTIVEWFHPNPIGQSEWAKMMATYGSFGFVPSVVRNNDSDIDLAVVVDNTGSMRDTIDAVKLNINAIVSELASKSTNYRMSIVTYRDYPPDGDYVSRVEAPFTDDLSQIRSAVDRMDADSGGDDPEAVYSGVMDAIREKWRTGVKKVIIVIGDAPPKDPEPVSGFTKASVAAAAIALDPASIWNIDESAMGEDMRAVVSATDGRTISSDQTAVVAGINDIIKQTASRPSAWLAGPQVIKVRTSLTLDASGSYDASGPLVRYDWDFNGDGIYDTSTTAPTVAHTFNAPFDGQVAVRVTNVGGINAVANTLMRATDDGDTIAASIDNCPHVANEDQADSNHNRIGDACDPARLFPTTDKPGVTIARTVAAPARSPSPSPSTHRNLEIAALLGGAVAGCVAVLILIGFRRRSLRVTATTNGGYQATTVRAAHTSESDWWKPGSSSGVTRCPRCGAVYRPRATFCGSCGAAVRDS